MAKRKTKRVQAQADPFEVPNPHQIANGDFHLTRTPHPEGGNRVAPTYVNRGGTPVMRWIAAGKLSDTQSLAISLCYRLWGITGITQRTIATYGERTTPSSTFNEAHALTEIDAREDLYRIMSYIPLAYWNVFENVCRFDEPAGVAGSRLGFGSRSSEDRAHTIVCFVADLIAMRENLVPEVRILVA